MNFTRTMRLILLQTLCFFFFSYPLRGAVPDYKNQQANRVALDIASAFGSERAAPAVQVVSRGNFVALYDNGLRKIMLSEAFYDICFEFGKDSLNALACVLGHELAHYYENHNYTGGFNEMLGVNAGTDLSIEKKKILETEADITGLKHAYFAGYDAYRLLPDVLDRIYTRMEITANSGYPSREERMAIARQQMKNMEPLVMAFESAAFLQMAGYEDAAMDIYDYLRRYDFVTPEVLNNIGAVYLNRALKLAKQNDEPEVFAYPCEVDPGDRLLKIINLRDVDVDEYGFLENVEKASGYFKSAIERDKKYAPAYLNIITAALIQQHTRQAGYYLNTLQEQYLLYSKPLPANFHLLAAIRSAKDGDYAAAGISFEKAKERNAYAIKYNLQAFDFLKKSMAEMFYDYVKLRMLVLSADLTTPSGNDKPGLFLLTDFNRGSYSIPEMKKSDYQKQVAYSADKGAFILAKAINPEKKLDYLKFTFSDFIIYSSSPASHRAPSLSNGIAIGDTYEVLQQQMGKPYREFVLSNGQIYLLYIENKDAKQGLLFKIKNDRIAHWQLFAVL